MDFLHIPLAIVFISQLVGQSQSAEYNISRLSYTPIKCYQCNIYSKGRPIDCEKYDLTPAAIKPICKACMLTRTVTSFHDRQGGDDKRHNYESRNFRKRGTAYSKYCITDEMFNRKEGCYGTYSPNGYTKLCVCKTHLCNGATGKLPINVLLYVTIAAVSWITCFERHR